MICARSTSLAVDVGEFTTCSTDFNSSWVISRTFKTLGNGLLLAEIYYPTIYLVQKVLEENEWFNKLQQEDLRGLTPLFYGHVNPYGRLLLNMDERIII